jgi:plastocyanin
MLNRRRVWSCLLVSLAVAVLVAGPGAVARASGGGGCGGPVTEATGTDVEIDRFCFSPTIIRAPVGAPVTWTNLDSTPHVVGGANMVWGSFEQLRKADTATYRFSEPGVYPYVCSWHPGMVGAVVVGDAGPALSGGALSVAPVSDDAGVRIEARPVATTSSADVATPWKILAAVAIGLFAVTLAAGLELRRRADRQR